MPTTIEYALHYASEFNWAVFPCHSIIEGRCTCGAASCKSPGKHPKTPQGSLNASTSPEVITDMFGTDEHANIGIATGDRSNLAVVDVDVVKGGSVDSLLAFEGIGPESLTDTPKVRTGGGWHFYFAIPQGMTVKNSASKLGAFVDVRGDGGYVIAPPSLHVSGRRYEIVNPENERIADFPAIWHKALNEVRTGTLPASSSQNLPSHESGSPLIIPVDGSSVILPDTIDQGKRNVELTRISGALRSKGLSETAIYAALRVENERICRPPLEDAELHQIARSVGRYKPQNVLGAVEDVGSENEDYENTLKPYLFGEFLCETFEEKEILGFHIGKRDIAIIQAATNAGKTTLLRNVALCMAAGRPFMPVFEGGRPIKIAYFDFESDAQDVQRDLRDMIAVFTPSERAIIDDQLIIIPKGLKAGELFQFNKHETWVNELITRNGVEFVIVDNVSAAYDLHDENSNAEVTRKIIKPLLRMAYKGNCAFLFAHHYGKGKIEQDSGVHAGRGASALQSLSRTVINMFGNVSEGETIEVVCAKRKTDGGQNYSISLKLENDRWFYHATKVQAERKQTAYRAIRRYMESVLAPDSRTTGDLILEFEDRYSEESVKKAVGELYKDGFLERPKHGTYSGKPREAAQNYYEREAA